MSSTLPRAAYTLELASRRSVRPPPSKSTFVSVVFFRVRSAETGDVLTWSEMIALLADDAAFALRWHSALRHVDSAFEVTTDWRIEANFVAEIASTPAAFAATASVYHGRGSWAAFAAPPADFRAHIDAGSVRAVAFSSLSKRNPSRLVAPLPASSDESADYHTVSRWIRDDAALPEQATELWATVGREISERVETEGGAWFLTEGHAVPWMHLRIQHPRDGRYLQWGQSESLAAACDRAFENASGDATVASVDM
jgi:hypothetical protein